MESIKTAVILAGGKGTRFSEYTKTVPKPMIIAKGQPLLVHIMNIYISQNITNFIILAGYKSEIILEFFAKNCKKVIDENRFFYKNDITVTVLDTGVETQTGGRIKKSLEIIKENYFYLTYGDGVGNIDIKKLTDFHFSNQTLATVTAVRPPARFGSLDLNEESMVESFGEKQNSKEGWINGGFFILHRSIGELINDDMMPLEKYPLEELANQKELKAYMHHGYWRPVDTIRELELLEEEMDNNLFKFIL